MRSRKDIRRLRIVVGSFMLIAGAVVLYVCATTTLTCTRGEAQEIRCQMRKVVAGFLTVQERAIHGLDGADTETRTSRPSITSRDSLARVGTRIVLITNEGDLSISNFGTTDTSAIVEDINQYVQDESQRELTVRHEFDGARLGSVAGGCLVLPMLIAIPVTMLGYLRRPQPRRRSRARKSGGQGS